MYINVFTVLLQGMIKEEQVDSFNIPQYTPSPSEVELEVLKEGSFSINLSELNWDTLDFEPERFESIGDDVAQWMRALAEPMLVSHFGEDIIEEVFSRYKQILAHRLSKEKTQLISVTLLLTRKT